MKRMLLLAACLAAPIYAKQADIAVLGGTVIDGSGAQGIEQDVLISDGKIVFVGTVMPAELDAKLVVDATGRVVTPGFIDTHAHGNPLTDNNFDNFLLQGVTTVTLGQDGTSPQNERVDYIEHLTFTEWSRAAAGLPVAFRGPITLRQWMAAVGRKGVEVNIAPLSGFGTNRALAGARTEAPITDEQLAKSTQILRDDLSAGAFGISNGLEYVPDRYAKTDELRRLAQEVGNAGGVVMSHMRSEDSDKIASAISELISQALPARVHIAHLKIVFARAPEEANGVLDQIREARRTGIPLSADVYPFYAGYADMTLVYPPWAKRREQWEDALRNRRFELEAALEDTVKRRNGPEAILISSGPFAGKTLKQIADEKGLSFVKVLTDVFGYGGPDAAHQVMLPAVQDRFVSAPDIAISTDGGPWINHPRSWGTYPQVLQNFVRDGKRIGLESAVYKMTGLPAAILAMKDRGLIRVGMAADLVVIDMAQISNEATWTNAATPPKGFDAVIVNGNLAVHFGKKQVGTFGQVLKRTGAGN